MANFEYSDSAVHKTVTIVDHTLEYSLALPDGVKAIEFQAREAVALRFAFNPVAGAVAASTEPFHTLKSGAVFFREHLYMQGNNTVIFACASDATHVEVTYWQ